MKNKNLIMAIAALQILVFHLWIPVFPANEIENFVRQTSSIGVELFFLVSGFAMANGRCDDYRKFIWNRFNSVYIKFVLFSIIALFYNSWTIIRLLKTIFMVNLFEKGGGAFLWFLPAIMLFYLIFPWIRKLERNINAKYTSNRHVTEKMLLMLLAIWLLIGVIVSNFTSYKAMFIWWNRIPVFLTGYYWGILNTTKSENRNYSKAELIAERYCEANRKRINFFAGSILLVIGFALIYIFAYHSKLQKPIRDLFYLVYIPATIGLAILMNLVDMDKIIKSSRYGDKVVVIIKKVGKSTLEIYAIQMIFGYGLANYVYRLTGIPLVSNIITMIVIVVLSIVITPST